MVQELVMAVLEQMAQMVLTQLLALCLLLKVAVVEEEVTLKDFLVVVVVEQEHETHLEVVEAAALEQQQIFTA